METRTTEAKPLCRACGKRDAAFLCQTYNEHSATVWLDNFRCRACGSVFIGNRISAEELTQAYATQDEALYYAETAAASEEKFSRAVQDLVSLRQHNARILDLGGGNGRFIRMLADAGCNELYIHEITEGPNSDVVGIVKRAFYGTDYASIPSDFFDIVTMMDVMEHVPTPEATLASACRVLKRGGYLYIHTPVVTALDRAMHTVQKLPKIGSVGRAWQRARTSIFHLQNYTPRALSNLLNRAGFQVVTLECRNELSWPIDRYIRVYVIEKQGLPRWSLGLLSAMAAPIVKSRFNANKAIVLARKT